MKLPKMYLIPVLFIAVLKGAFAEDATITVQANHVLHPISRYLTGACIEDVNHEVYGGIYSQMIFGESFAEPAPQRPLGDSSVSGMWRPFRRGSAEGAFSIEGQNAFSGRQSQQITFSGGAGEIGIENQGLNRWGMNFVKDKPYEGHLWVRAGKATSLFVALESKDGAKVYAEQSLQAVAGDWQRLDFTLEPNASDTDGQFAIKLKQPGSVVVGYAFLEPGAWGRFAGLPVRKDVAEALMNQGITVLRYGGSMVNAAEYRWTNMIGPRDRRPPYAGTWYPYSSDGWGIPDFLNFCEAAGLLGVPDFNINEAPQDMANFVRYANGPSNTVWGAKRMADGHPQPYNLKCLELGNEERVDNTYYQKFRAIAQAIWAVDSNMTLVVGDLQYSQVITNPFNFSGAASGITTLATHQQILRLARQNHRAIWFDVHVWDDGPAVDPSLTAMFSYDDALGQIADGADYKVVVFELNANHPNQGRALGNALAINAAERDGRLPIVTSANCLQPDGENDNGWDQGLLFLNPSQVWLQPSGYVTRMYSDHYQPLEVWSRVVDPGNHLDVSAARSLDGSRLVLKVVNPGSKPAPAVLIVQGQGHLRYRTAMVEELAGNIEQMNSADAPKRICPLDKKRIPQFKNSRVKYTFAPDSVTVIQFSK